MAEDGTPKDRDEAFFARILRDDIEHIVKRAESGAPLTARERELIERERTRLAMTPSAEAVGEVFELVGGSEGPLVGLTYGNWRFSGATPYARSRIGRPMGRLPRIRHL